MSPLLLGSLSSPWIVDSFLVLLFKALGLRKSFRKFAVYQGKEGRKTLSDVNFCSSFPSVLASLIVLSRIKACTSNISAILLFSAPYGENGGILSMLIWVILDSALLLPLFNPCKARGQKSSGTGQDKRNVQHMLSKIWRANNLVARVVESAVAAE